VVVAQPCSQLGHGGGELCGPVVVGLGVLQLVGGGGVVVGLGVLQLVGGGGVVVGLGVLQVVGGGVVVGLGTTLVVGGGLLGFGTVDPGGGTLPVPP
jgi:hypothetical protein